MGAADEHALSLEKELEIDQKSSERATTHQLRKNLMQGLEKKEGIVLRSVDFKERERILTVITESGLIQLIVKNLTKKKPELLLLTTPFCHGEFVYFRGRSDLFIFQEGKVFKEYYSQQKSWRQMQALGHLAKTILHSQLPGNPAPLLFALLTSYLEKLPQMEDPHSLCLSFYLKILTHEGLLMLDTQCCFCQRESSQCLFEGQSYCLKDAPPHSVLFTKDEWEKLLLLAQTRTFKELDRCVVSASLLKKVSDYFLELVYTETHSKFSFGQRESSRDSGIVNHLILEI